MATATGLSSSSPRAARRRALLTSLPMPSRPDVLVECDAIKLRGSQHLPQVQRFHVCLRRPLPLTAVKLVQSIVVGPTELVDYHSRRWCRQASRPLGLADVPAYGVSRSGTWKWFARDRWTPLPRSPRRRGGTGAQDTSSLKPWSSTWTAASWYLGPCSRAGHRGVRPAGCDVQPAAKLDVPPDRKALGPARSLLW